MAEKRTIGLKSIKIGDIAGDGGMGTVLAALGNTYEGTATLMQDDAEETPFYAEELDDPIEILEKKGNLKVEWAIVDFDPTTLQKVLGGEVTGAAPNQKWEAPSDMPSIEKSIEIITKKNVKFEIVRARIVAKLDVNLSKKEMGLVRISATVMAPTKADTAPMSISHVAA